MFSGLDVADGVHRRAHNFHIVLVCEFDTGITCGLFRPSQILCTIMIVGNVGVARDGVKHMLGTILD